ncbi:MAG TPA: protein kinase [Burkholderiales bacterium]|nr:protein kinase [Burkholderiales bacterium]
MATQANKLGRYEVLHELGRGAMGVVHAARDRSTRAVVALKTLDPALFNEPNLNFAEFFRKDARSAERLKHRNIVKIHDAGEAGGTAYVAMELLEGESLRKILDDGPLSISRAIRIADEVACGLAYAHEAGVVHRGIKPSNIIVLRSGGVKISDFGIGHLGEAAILSGLWAGCLSCMSPEQVRGDPVDGRSDIFSLGAVFYEMLTRRPPFKGDSPNEIIEKILHAELPPPSEVNPHVPRALDRIVLSMLAGHPGDRVPDARILLRDLQRLEEKLGLGPGTTADAEEPAATEPAAPQPPPEREPGLRTPNPNRFRGRAPMQDAPRHDQAFDEREAMSIMEREFEPERSLGSRPAIFAALALVLAVLAIGLTVVWYYSSGPTERRIAASGMQQAPATAPAPSRPTAPPPMAEAPNEPATAPAAPQASPPRAVGDAGAEQESLGIVSAPKPMPPKPLAAEPSPPAQTERAGAPEQPAAAGTAPAQEVPRATQPTANVPARQPGGTATLIIAVSPQGEIYIDGKHYGTTPPITTLDLEPGMHSIEVRSGSRKPYLTYMTVQAGDVRRIRHDFGAKPSRPPT